MREGLRITVLGKLSIEVNGELSAAPSAPKERKLLVLLMLNHGRTVAVSTLIDELWGSGPPRRARAALQTYVLNIRSNLSHELRLPGSWIRSNLISTSKEGYQFCAQRAQFDLQEYARLGGAGENALLAGDDAQATTLLRAAEDLWTGSILPDVEHGVPLASEITRLEQRRLALRELRIEAELRMGRHRELVGELSMLALQNPYHERLHEYLMFALCSSGRSVQALEVFQRLRRSMVEEMGMEPSRRIQKLHQDILWSGVPKTTDGPILMWRSLENP